MKGRVVILDEINERQLAALVVDGQLEELAIDPAGDDILPGAIYRAAFSALVLRANATPPSPSTPISPMVSPP